MGKILTQFLYEGSEKGAPKILDCKTYQGDDLLEEFNKGALGSFIMGRLSDEEKISGKAIGRMSHEETTSSGSWTITSTRYDSQYALSFTLTDWAVGKINIDENGLPTNIGMNGVSSGDLIKEFEEEGLKVAGVDLPKLEVLAKSGKVTFFFEGDPATLQKKFDALIKKSVAEMNSAKNLTDFEQKLIAGVRDAFTHNTEKASMKWNDGVELSEGERLKIHDLVSELSKPDVNYTGTFSEKDLSTLSASTGIDPQVLAQAAAKVK